MNPLSYSLLLLQLHNAPMPAQKPYPDAWFAEDKMKHMLTSTAVVGFAHAGARLVTDTKTAVVVAVAAGAAAGIWKEIHDRKIGRIFSKRDLVWDALGIGLGVVVVSQAR